MSKLPAKSESRNIQRRHTRNYKSGKEVTINPKNKKTEAKRMPSTFTASARTKRPTVLPFKRPQSIFSIAPVLPAKIALALKSLEGFKNKIREKRAFRKLFYGMINQNKNLFYELIYNEWKRRTTGRNLGISEADKELDKFISSHIGTSEWRDWYKDKNRMVLGNYGDWSQYQGPGRDILRNPAKDIWGQPFYYYDTFWDPFDKQIFRLTKDNDLIIDKNFKILRQYDFPVLPRDAASEQARKAGQFWKKQYGLKVSDEDKEAVVLFKELNRAKIPFILATSSDKTTFILPKNQIVKAKSTTAGPHSMPAFQEDIMIGTLTGPFSYEYRESRDLKGVKGYDLIIWEEQGEKKPMPRYDLSFFFHKKDKLEEYLNRFKKHMQTLTYDPLDIYNLTTMGARDFLYRYGRMPDEKFFYIFRFPKSGTYRTYIWDGRGYPALPKLIVSKPHSTLQTGLKLIREVGRSSNLFKGMYEIDLAKTNKKLKYNRDRRKLVQGISEVKLSKNI